MAEWSVGKRAAARKALEDSRRGLRYGRLLVLGVDPQKRQNDLCLCDCGERRSVFRHSLLRGHTRSCGCLGRELGKRGKPWKRKHGGCRTDEYNIWIKIKDRCFNESSPAHKHYGARGITMCDRWKDDFGNFLADMGPRPGKDYSIERSDVNGNYEPGNCRWATAKEQQNNRRNNHIVEAFGKKQTIAAWAEETGIIAGTIYARIYAGMSPERALTPGALPPRDLGAKAGTAGNARTRAADVKALMAFRLRQSGMLLREVAEAMGVGHSYLGLMLTRARWLQREHPDRFAVAEKQARAAGVDLVERARLLGPCSRSPCGLDQKSG